jgi:GNAT superfamily N-acetyltransferase
LSYVFNDPCIDNFMAIITKRRVDQPEAKILVDQIKHTPNIIGYTLKEWMNSEHMFIAENEHGQILGACLNYDFAQNWTKIAALYVFEEFRNQGIGKALFSESYNDSIKRHKNIYTISCNPIVLNMLTQLEFVTFANLLNFPVCFKHDRLDFYIHTLQWLSNPYRIKEITRKHIIDRPEQAFVYGLKACSVI